MTNEIQELINKLGLLPHPEGGFYKETYRSSEEIPGKGRSLQTAIYFLLTSSNVSRFHRIKSDEIWFHHAGSPLIVHMLDDSGYHTQVVGMDLDAGQTPQFLVPANTIFGSTVLEEDSYTLVSCTVAPGFDFKDFELFNAETLCSLYPEHSEIIDRLT